MVHLYPDYPLPLPHTARQRRGCSDSLWLALIFFLMLCTMIGLECLRRSSNSRSGSRSGSKIIPVDELLGGSAFGPIEDNQIKPEKPLKNGGILIGTGSGEPVVSTLMGTPDQITITNGAGSITISAPQDLRPAPTNGQIEIGTTNGDKYEGTFPALRLVDKNGNPLLPMYLDTTRKSGYDELKISPMPSIRDRYPPDHRVECHADSFMFDNKGRVSCK